MSDDTIRDDEILDDEILDGDPSEDDEMIDAPTPPAEDEDPRGNPYLQIMIHGVLTNFPRQAGERIKAMSPAEFGEFQSIRNQCRVDTIFCGNFLLGLSLSENPHRSFVNFFVHRKVGTDLALLDTEFKRRLLLAPRGSAKTHFVRADIFSWLLLFPNIRVVYLSGGESVAVPQLQALARGFSQPTKNMVKYFPEYVFEPKSKWSKKNQQWEDVLVGENLGTMHHFTVPCRTNKTLPEATFTLATPESVSSGIHAELVYCDDLVNNTTKTVEAHKKAFQNYLDVLPLVQPTGFLFVSGTRYKGGQPPDAYGQIMQRASTESRWKYLVEDCFSTNCKTVLSDGTICGRPECFHDRTVNVLQGPSIPEIPGQPCPGFQSDGVVVPYCPVVKCRDGEYGYTLDFLRMQQSESAEFFALQYMNDPSLIQKSKAVFNETILGRQTLHTQQQILDKFPPAFSQVYLMVDPAYSSAEFGEHRDETVILAFSKRGGDIIFWNAWFGQWAARERTQKIVAALHAVRPKDCFIESNLNAESAEILIVDAARAAGLAQVPIRARVPKRQKGARTIRMEAAAQLFDTGRVWLYAGLPNYEKLVRQAVEYPEGVHDDHIDCLAQAVEAAIEVLYVLNEPHRVIGSGGQGGPLNWLHKLNAAREPEWGGKNDGSQACGME
jgi:predicted phage terminase large subunit-like protein